MATFRKESIPDLDDESTIIGLDEHSTDDYEVVHQKARRFVELSKRERELKAELEEVQEEKRHLEPELLRGFENGQIQRLTIAGVTVYVHRQLWASPKDGDYRRACAALRDAGWGHMVQDRFNTNTLSAAVRELDRLGDDLPAGLETAIEVQEVYSLRTRAR